MAAVTEAPPAHEPYVPDGVTMPEFTLVPIIVGAVLGIVFGASSIYLVLKVGMTVSASIPVAVLSITLFRGMSRLFGLRPATILENNIVQTTGSAGESIAFGVGVTMPALMVLGFDMTLGRVMLVSLLGGLLGIFMMIPLRRAFIVKLHGKPGEPGKLLYPEGTACAQVLISGEKGGTTGLTVFLTFFLGQEIHWGSAILGAVLVVLFGFLFVTVSSRLTGEIGSSSNPISGMTVATLMLTCFLFLTMDMTSPAEKVLALSIGAVVCIAASNGGTTSQDLKTGYLVGATPRLQQWAIIIGALTSALFIGGTLLYFNQAGTIYTQKDLPSLNLKEKLATFQEKETYQGQTYFVWRPLQGEYDKVEAGNYLVDEAGAVRYLVDPGIMGKRTHRDDGSKVSREFEAPKTQVMALIINSVLGGKLNWTLLVIGAMIALTLELCGISSLAFAVGVYVPIQFSVPVFLGGLVRWALDAFMSRSTAPAPTGDAALDAEVRARAEVEAIAKTESSPGVLMASGYIAGGSLAGVLIAFLEFAPDFKDHVLDQSERVKDTWLDAPLPAILCFAGLIGILALVGMGKFLASPPEEVQAANQGPHSRNPDNPIQ